MSEKAPSSCIRQDDSHPFDPKLVNLKMHLALCLGSSSCKATTSNTVYPLDLLHCFVLSTGCTTWLLSLPLTISLIFCILPHVLFPDVSKGVFELFPKTAAESGFLPAWRCFFSNVIPEQSEQVELTQVGQSPRKLLERVWAARRDWELPKRLKHGGQLSLRN